MPFIFIDQGAAAIRHYSATESPLLKKVNDIAPMKKVISKADQQRQSAYHQAGSTSHKVTTAQEIMSHPVHFIEQEDASIETAWDILQTHSIKHLPITKNNKLIGVVTERDILKIYALKNADKEHWYKTKVFAASLTMDIHQLSQVLFDEKIGCLPIVDEQQLLKGIITRSDILKISSQYGPLEFWA